MGSIGDAPPSGLIEAASRFMTTTVASLAASRRRADCCPAGNPLRDSVGPMQLPRSLQSDSHDRAVVLLRAYYAPLSMRKTGYTGGQFDAFDPSGTRSTSANTFTSDDLVSLSLLSAPMPGRAAYELLVRQRRRFEVLLEDLGPDRDFVDEKSVARDDYAPAWNLWQALHALPDLGPTRVSKLMARKRPRLIPIFDDVLSATVFTGTTNHWNDLWNYLRNPTTALYEGFSRFARKPDSINGFPHSVCSTFALGGLNMATSKQGESGTRTGRAVRRFRVRGRKDASRPWSIRARRVIQPPTKISGGYVRRSPSWSRRRHFLYFLIRAIQSLKRFSSASSSSGSGAMKFASGAWS